MAAAPAALGKLLEVYLEEGNICFPLLRVPDSAMESVKSMPAKVQVQTQECSLSGMDLGKPYTSPTPSGLFPSPFRHPPVPPRNSTLCLPATLHTLASRPSSYCQCPGLLLWWQWSAQTSSLVMLRLCVPQICLTACLLHLALALGCSPIEWGSMFWPLHGMYPFRKFLN